MQRFLYTLRIISHNIFYAHTLLTRDDVGEISTCGRRFSRHNWRAWFRPRIGNDWGIWQEITPEQAHEIIINNKLPEEWGVYG